MPVLYSFRRCPYAMRARIALYVAKMSVVLREVDLKNKPSEMLEVSPKGTVPVLLLSDGQVIDESLDIIDYVLPDSSSHQSTQLIEKLQKQMIPALNRYKYFEHFENVDRDEEKRILCEFFSELEELLADSTFLFSNKLSKADIAILPFVRQFYKVDAEDFDLLPYPKMKEWFNHFISSEMHDLVMKKYPVWEAVQENVFFPVNS